VVLVWGSRVDLFERRSGLADRRLGRANLSAEVAVMRVGWVASRRTNSVAIMHFGAGWTQSATGW
jgi:hypothetical protein